MTAHEAICSKFVFNGRKRNLPWYPRKGTRVELAEVFGLLGFKRGVEVGTQRGLWAKTLFEKVPGLHLTCVDQWAAYNGISQERQDRIYSEAMTNLSGRNVEILRKGSLDVVRTIPDGSLDFVFIDGNHVFDAVMQDIIQWVPKVKKDGIVAAHDYHYYTGSDVIWAVNAYTHCHHIDPWYVTREITTTAFWVQR